jgi:6-pyruvoyltetrahydropterin/6-carboxytetrahydropterin synthase
MATTLTRIVRFTAHHRYFRPEWSEERNRAAFGACAEAPGHAHDYLCAVTVGGAVAADTGMIMDLGVLDRILAEEVTGRLHGRHFNLDIPEFAYGKTIPTGEAVAGYFYQRIRQRLPDGVRLERVRVQEDASLFADCTGQS